jgi:shikimate dehydrogenase
LENRAARREVLATRIYGLIGTPIGHSLSPAIHREAFAELSMEAAYLPFEVAEDAFAAALAGARVLGIAGLNVTRPFKEVAAAACDRLAEAAARARAANVLVWRQDGSLEGDNTDGEAIRWALEERGVVPAGRAALVLGAGGSARGAAFSLAAAGARVAVCGRTEGRARALVADLALAGLEGRIVPWPDRFWAVAESQIVVQATPLGGGAKGRGSPLGRDTDSVPWAEGACLVELAYGPAVTPLARAAAAAGCTVVDGVDVLCRQAALSWELWFGLRGPLAAMQRAARAALAQSEGGDPT